LLKSMVMPFDRFRWFALPCFIISSIKQIFWSYETNAHDKLTIEKILNITDKTIKKQDG
jgi:hypothetical protein